MKRIIQIAHNSKNNFFSCRKSTLSFSPTLLFVCFFDCELVSWNGEQTVLTRDVHVVTIYAFSHYFHVFGVDRNRADATDLLKQWRRRVTEWRIWFGICLRLLYRSANSVQCNVRIEICPTRKVFEGTLRLFALSGLLF